jgi:hypothetical protein
MNAFELGYIVGGLTKQAEEDLWALGGLYGGLGGGAIGALYGKDRKAKDRIRTALIGAILGAGAGTLTGEGLERFSGVGNSISSGLGGIRDSLKDISKNTREGTGSVSRAVDSLTARVGDGVSPYDSYGNPRPSMGDTLVGQLKNIYNKLPSKN